MLGAFLAFVGKCVSTQSTGSGGNQSAYQGALLHAMASMCTLNRPAPLYHTHTLTLSAPGKQG